MRSGDSIDPAARRRAHNRIGDEALPSTGAAADGHVRAALEVGFSSLLLARSGAGPDFAKRPLGESKQGRGPVPPQAVARTRR